MNTYKIARVAACFRRPVAMSNGQRRGYADAVSDKIKLTLALPHQVQHDSPAQHQSNVPAED